MNIFNIFYCIVFVAFDVRVQYIIYNRWPVIHRWMWVINDNLTLTVSTMCYDIFILLALFVVMYMFFYIHTVYFFYLWHSYPFCLVFAL